MPTTATPMPAATTRSRTPSPRFATDCLDGERGYWVLDRLTDEWLTVSKMRWIADDLVALLNHLAATNDPRLDATIEAVDQDNLDLLRPILQAFVRVHGTANPALPADEAWGRPADPVPSTA